jgi:hypothetical protein
MTGYVRCEAAAERARQNRILQEADYQPTKDSASIPNLFRKIPQERNASSEQQLPKQALSLCNSRAVSLSHGKAAGEFSGHVFRP